MRKLEELRRLKNWAGYVKGFYCEIVCWWPNRNDPDDKSPPMWNYYITIRREQLPNNFEKFIGKRIVDICKYTGKEKVRYSYCCDVDIEMGITFYEPTFNDKGEIVSVKIGCDYNHSWDQDRLEFYDERYLFGDLKRTIDSIIEAFPDCRIRCYGTGLFYPADCGEFKENGGFYSFDYTKSWKLERFFRFLRRLDSGDWNKW